MMQAVLDAVLSALQAAGIRAVPQYPALALDKNTPTVCVGVRSQTLTSPGFGSYLGKGEHQGAATEQYGVKADLTVLLDLYVPGGQAAAAQTLFAGVSGALAALPSGVRARTLTRGELAPDRAVGMLRCPCELACTAYFVCAVEEDSGRWLDFELRGVLKHERE